MSWTRGHTRRRLQYGSDLKTAGKRKLRARERAHLARVAKGDHLAPQPLPKEASNPWNYD